VALKAAKVKKRSGEEEKKLMVGRLLAWYDKNRRLMPWRALAGQKTDPYRVWLSEIMLQQTTVAAVGPYFQKFIKRWPSLNHLAAASQDDILRMWAGLGYYRRARMLYQCALYVHDKYGGLFPDTEEALLELPGFGPYTAAAVAAIAFDRSANVVDGNVERIMARLFAIQDPLPKAKIKLRAAAATLVPQKRCGDYAQALMDLGATICTPRSPKCALCPWQKSCKAHAFGIEEQLPKRVRKKMRPVRRAIAFVIQNKKDEVLLRQRPANGLLASMMEVPSTPWTESEMPSLSQALKYAPFKAKWNLRPGLVFHVFSHFTLEVAVAVAVTNKTLEGRWIASNRLDDEALPSVMKKIVHYGLKTL
jgi:A/G-specific adenine glycosylase